MRGFPAWVVEEELLPPGIPASSLPPQKSRPIAIVFSDDESTVAAATETGAVHVASTADGVLVGSIQLENGNRQIEPREIALALDETGRQLATAVRGDPKIRYWSVGEGRQIGELPNPAYRLGHVTLSADGRTFGFGYREVALAGPFREMTLVYVARNLWPNEIVEHIRARLEPPSCAELRFPRGATFFPWPIQWPPDISGRAGGKPQAGG